MNALSKRTAVETASSAGNHSNAHGSNSLSRKDFERLAKFINSYSGIKMPPNKLTMVEGRLRRRLKAGLRDGVSLGRGTGLQRTVLAAQRSIAALGVFAAHEEGQQVLEAPAFRSP